MLGLGSYFLLFYLVVLFMVYRREETLIRARWMHFIAMISVPLMWICSEAGWVVAEVGRQPWTVQDLLPTWAAVSDVPASSVIVTFWMFAIIFTILLAAEVSIMINWVRKSTRKDLNK